MKINDLIELPLNEMNMRDVKFIWVELSKFLSSKGLELILTDHAVVDRLLNDPSRMDITADNFVNTIKALFSNKNFQEINYNKVDFEGVVTNYLTNLNIIFYIGHKKFKILTAKISSDFRTDNKATKRFGVKV